MKVAVADHPDYLDGYDKVIAVEDTTKETIIGILNGSIDNRLDDGYTVTIAGFDGSYVTVDHKRMDNLIELDYDDHPGTPDPDAVLEALNPSWSYSLTGSSLTFDHGDLLAVDPAGCGCTECIIGEYLPADQANDTHLYSIITGDLSNNDPGGYSIEFSRNRIDVSGSLSGSWSTEDFDVLPTPYDLIRILNRV